MEVVSELQIERLSDCIANPENEALAKKPELLEECQKLVEDAVQAMVLRRTAEEIETIVKIAENMRDNKKGCRTIGLRILSYSSSGITDLARQQLEPRTAVERPTHSRHAPLGYRPSGHSR